MMSKRPYCDDNETLLSNSESSECSSDDDRAVKSVAKRAKRKQQIRKSKSTAAKPNPALCKPRSHARWSVEVVQQEHEVFLEEYNSFDAVWKAYDHYSIQNCLEFLTGHDSLVYKDLGEVIKKRIEGNTRIYFHEYKLSKVLPVMKVYQEKTIPFIILGLKTLDCRHGPKFGIYKKCKSLNAELAKRKNCLAIVKFVQVAYFRQYEVILDSEPNRQSSIQRLKSDINSGNIQAEIKYYLGITDNHNHAVGEDNAEYLRLDKRVRDECVLLINGGNKVVPKLQTLLDNFVEKLIKSDTIPRPIKTSRRFYPTLNQITAIINTEQDKLRKDPNYEQSIAATVKEGNIRSVGVSTTMKAPILDISKTANRSTQTIVGYTPVKTKIAEHGTQMHITRAKFRTIGTQTIINVMNKPLTKKLQPTKTLTQKQRDSNRKIARSLNCLTIEHELSNMDEIVQFRTVCQLYLNRISAQVSSCQHKDELTAIGNSLKSLHAASKHLIKSRYKVRNAKPPVLAKSNDINYQLTHHSFKRRKTPAKPNFDKQTEPENNGSPKKACFAEFSLDDESAESLTPSANTNNQSSGSPKTQTTGTSTIVSSSEGAGPQVILVKTPHSKNNKMKSLIGTKTLCPGSKSPPATVKLASKNKSKEKPGSITKDEADEMRGVTLKSNKPVGTWMRVTTSRSSIDVKPKPLFLAGALKNIPTSDKTEELDHIATEDIIDCEEEPVVDKTEKNPEGSRKERIETVEPMEEFAESEVIPAVEIIVKTENDSEMVEEDS